MTDSDWPPADPAYRGTQPGGEIEPGGGVGVLGAIVWPVYVGFGIDPDQDLPQDKRFQIQWADEGGVLVGHADPVVDAGEYPFLLYFHAPVGPPSFAATFTHPYRTRGGRAHVGPILYVGNEITAEVP